MGSWYRLELGDVAIVNGKNYLSAECLLPFQSSDLEIDELDDVPVLRFDAPARVVARRLDLLGHSLAAAAASYAAGLPRACEDHPDYAWPPDLARWQESFHDRVKAMEPDARNYVITTESNAWEDYHLGFPGGLWEAVRALIEVAPDVSMSLDLSDLAGGGWVAPDGSDLPLGVARQPLIIVTEGKSDARLLRRAFETLHGDCCEFVRFLDYDAARAAGGVPEVVRFIRMFAGCGISNRVVILLDNDGAGHDALAQLKGLPANFFPMTLPPLPLFAAYPVASLASVPTREDIHEAACSLELYLGVHSLTDRMGNLVPVQWRGPAGGSQRKQGVVSDKAAVQQRFEDSLRAVEEGHARSSFDFSGVDAIVDALVALVASR